jgi:glycosyltransferase involved in cell wall biosynthesis
MELPRAPDMKTVAFLNEVIPQYRIPFFEGLSASLRSEGVQLRVAQGAASSRFALRQDSRTLPGAISMPQRNLSLGRHDLVWLDTAQVLEAADLVIAIQQIRQLQNLTLWLRSRLGQHRLAWWGHGRDFAKEDPNTLGERVKRAMSTRAHWWFAYNELSTRTVAALGFPEARITTVMNSTDTTALREHQASITAEDQSRLRRRLGLHEGPTAIYIGAMASIKQLPYLIEAAATLHARVPDFQLLMVGAGPEEGEYRAQTADQPWIHWLGPAFDRYKVQLMMLAQVCLLPAWVGLGIVDSFALGLPMVTTDAFPHSVEIDYMRHGENGWMVSGHPNSAAYGHAVADLLADPGTLARLREGCRTSTHTYSLERMISNFTVGILQALEAAPYRRPRP